jgi:isochorismate synthase
MGAAPQTYSIELIYKTAIAQNRAVAVWRLPYSEEIQLCVSLQDNLLTGQPELETSALGFLFCPFLVTKEHPNIFIKADIHFNDSRESELNTPSDIPQEAFEEFVKALGNKSDNNAGWYTPLTVPRQKHQSKAGFLTAVDKAMVLIHEDAMEKVVLSRNLKEPLPKSFSILAAFEAMQKEYPKAFVSLVSVPGVGTWMGASPEILVSINSDQMFHTVALAGTQPAAASTADAIWRQKEIEEQGMVERYIVSCFKSLRLREYTEVGPRTIIAGNLMHLRTDFKVDLKDVDFPTLGTDMLALLHPTSAVCGLPKKPALEFIATHEGYDRAYYSGFLGPVNSKDGTHIFVNLRCMEIQEKDAILYAGAGITGDSKPQKEWLETHHKMQTMRKILSIFE